MLTLSQSNWIEISLMLNNQILLHFEWLKWWTFENFYYCLNSFKNQLLPTLKNFSLAKCYVETSFLKAFTENLFSIKLKFFKIKHFYCAILQAPANYKSLSPSTRRSRHFRERPNAPAAASIVISAWKECQTIHIRASRAVLSDGSQAIGSVAGTW